MDRSKTYLIHSVIGKRYEFLTRSTVTTQTDMYNTTCNRLVNRKCATHFIQHDMIEIFTKIQQPLASENCTTDQFNDQIRQMVKSYCTNISSHSEQEVWMISRDVYLLLFM